MIEKELVMQFKEANQKIINIMQKKVDDYELTLGLLHLLMTIMHKPDTTQKELAKEMRFTEGAMSMSVKRLLKLGLIEQVQCQSDGRCNRLVVTEKGKKIAKDYKHYLYNIMQNVFKEFNVEELEMIHGFLMKINSNLDQVLSDIND